MSRPLVSIVIDNFNYGRFLRAAIDSALEQSYGSTEVVVVDDGSTDDSREIIAAYGDRVVPVLKDNGGQASAFNAGFAASSGNVVVFLDSDDALLSAAAATAAEALDEGFAKAHWPLWEVDAGGRRTGATVPPDPEELAEGDARALAIEEGPMAHYYPPTSGNAWTRRFLRAVLPIPEDEFRDIADAYLLALAPLAGPIARVLEPLGEYRIHGGNREGGRSRYEANEILLETYHRQCDAMTRLLEAEGAEFDPDAWRTGNPHYGWREALRAGSEEIRTLIPEGERFVLVDDDEWNHHWGTNEVIPGRYAVPFVEREGRYWGRPADDDEAIREVERLRREGPRRMVIAYPAFWWLEHYSGFHAHLRKRCRCVHESEHVLAFDLEEPVA